MKKSGTTFVGTTIVTGLAGTLMGAPVPELVTAGVVAGGASAVSAPFVSDSRQLMFKDSLISLLPTIGSSVAVGLTYGWGHAILGLLAGPVASLLRAALNKEEEGVLYH